jgi:shikimate kinase
MTPRPRTGELRERVYLAGFMGSGKSTIGPILANSLGYGFVDVDRAIERSTGKTVSAIFRDEGEERFRTLERELVAGICLQPRLVVALGGGTLLDPETMRMLRATGILVYLKVPPDQITRRVAARSDRPMLLDASGKRLGDAELRDRVEHLYRLREPLYALAEITLTTDGKRLGWTVDELVRLLTPRLVPYR